jgi:uncharacterized membrane protein
MKPLLVLLVTFGISLVATKITRGSYDFAWSGRLAMSGMLVFTGIAHFTFTKGMEMMLPQFIPFKTTTVYLTGIIEIAAAIGLFIPNFRILTGWLLIAFFMLILPANIYAAIKQVDFQKANFEGHGLTYLLFRIPLQFLFIGWTYLSAMKE